MEHPKIRQDGDTLYLNFGEYGGSVDVAAVSGDGNRALLVREVGVARVWDFTRERWVAEIAPTSPLTGRMGVGPTTRPFEVFIESAALDRRGALALLGLNDRTAVLVRVDTGEAVAVLADPEISAPEWGVVRAVAFSPDDRLALVGLLGRRVGVWAPDGTFVAVHRGALGDRIVSSPFVRDTLVTSVACSPDGRYVFAGTVDTAASVHELATGREVWSAVAHAEELLAIEDGPAGPTWATTGGRVWRARDGDVAECVLDTGEWWAEVALDGDRCLARTQEGGVALWHLDGTCRRLAPAPEARVLRSDEAVTLALAEGWIGYPRGALDWVLEAGGRVVSVRCEGRTITDVCVSASGRTFATKTGADALEVWDAATGARLHRLPCPGGVGCAAFSPDERLVAVGEIGHGGGHYPRSIYVYDVASGALRATLVGHDWQVRTVVFAPDGATLVSVGGAVLAWDPGGGAPREVVTDVSFDVEVAFAGSRIVLVERERVTVFEGERPALVFPAPIGFRTLWRIHPDGEHLLVAGEQELLSFALSTGALARRAAADVPRSEGFPPRDLFEGHQLQNVAALWRTPWGSFLHQSDGPRGWVRPLAWSEPGDLVVVGGAGGAVVLRATAQGAELVQELTFADRLRVGRVAGDHVVLVGCGGEVARYPLVDQRG